MEADLSRFHQIRYTDRWRRDENGQRKLTMREIWVRIEDLPGDSRIVKHFNGGRPRWGDETFLIADLIHAFTGKAHPARPKPAKGSDARETPRRAKIRQQRIREKRIREKARRERSMQKQQKE